MNCIQEAAEILDLLYKHGWDERNGGNLSYLLNREDVKTVADPDQILGTFHYSFDFGELKGRYLLITGTGKYFKNCLKDPDHNLAILRVNESGHDLDLVWGFLEGGKPTSEAPTHLKSHIERLKVDPHHRVVIHCHPTNVIAMTHVHDLNENHWTEDLWKMQTESIVVFPEGIGLLPWMLCGGTDIGCATSEKMKTYRAVVWAQHGIFCTGSNLDETFGLVETIEKAAEIYLKVFDKKIYQSITNENLVCLAQAFRVNYKKGVID